MAVVVVIVDVIDCLKCPLDVEVHLIESFPVGPSRCSVMLDECPNIKRLQDADFSTSSLPLGDSMWLQPVTPPLRFLQPGVQ